MASDGKEERRRRIMEKGSDRMALITGQIQTLNASLPSSTTTTSYSHHDNAHDHNESSPSSLASQHSQIHANHDDESGSELPKQKAGSEENNLVIGNQVELPHFQERVTPTEAIRSPCFNDKSEIQRSVVTPPIQKASDQAYKYFFTSKRINSCIISSQRTRACCSLIIASLVLISYVDYPLLGINIVRSESIIASRPLYIILLTDITIVLARLFRERGAYGYEQYSEREGIMVAKVDAGDRNWVGAVKLLERGLAMYQAIRGIFIDCSVYLVVLICGLSLM